jgi:hypothetical protein
MRYPLRQTFFKNQTFDLNKGVLATEAFLYSGSLRLGLDLLCHGTALGLFCPTVRQSLLFDLA